MRWDVLCALVVSELCRLWRTPAFSVPTLVLPSMFFLFFGVPHLSSTLEGLRAAEYMLVSFSTFSVMSVGLFSFGVSVANERESGWNKLIRLAPVSSWLYLLSKLIVAALFGAASIFGLLLVASFFAEGGISLMLCITLFTLVLPGVVPFSALGLAIGYLCPAHAASAVANIVFLPLAFASGLFVPLSALPVVVQDLAPLLPSYHLAAMGWRRVAGHGPGEILPSLLVLLCFTAASLWLAQWAHRREESREFG
jgi:ABC-2 type transport system permease protein